MKTAYRLFIFATLAALAWGAGTASSTDDPWTIWTPTLILWAVASIQQLRRDRDSTPPTDSA